MGKTGKAVHLMENPDSLANYTKVYHDVQNFLDHKNIVDRFYYVESLLQDEKMVELFLEILTHVLRSKMLEGESRLRFAEVLSRVGEAGALNKKNVNSRLLLENLMLML